LLLVLFLLYASEFLAISRVGLEVTSHVNSRQVNEILPLPIVVCTSKNAKNLNIGQKNFSLIFKPSMPCFYSERGFSANISMEKEIFQLKGHVDSLPWKQVCLRVSFCDRKGTKDHSLPSKSRHYSPLGDWYLF